MQLFLALLSILGLAVTSPVDIAKLQENLLNGDVEARNSVLENLVLNLLEDLRQTMLTGSDDVPVLDPLDVEHLHLDDEVLPLPSAHLTVKDLQVSKLSTFVVDSLTVRTTSIIPLRYRLEFDIQVPVLQAEAGNYDISVSAAGVNIFGNGDAKINITELRVQGSIVMGPRITIGTGLFFTITSSEVKLSLKDFESKITGLLNDEAMSAFISTFLKHFVPELLQIYETEITKFLSDTVQDVGNDLLANLDLAGILG